MEKLSKSITLVCFGFGLAAKYFQIAPEQILIAHDELDMPPGASRFKFDGGHGGHNGLRDIIPPLGGPRHSGD